MTDALADLPVLGPGEPAEHRWVDGFLMLNGSTMKHSDAVIRKIRAIEAGRGPISYRRLHEDLARTIVAGHRALPVHPVEHRTISVREAARIQGFPDSYVFCGGRGAQPLQVANAVPPPLAAAIAGALLEEPDAREARRPPEIALPATGPGLVELPGPHAAPTQHFRRDVEPAPALA